MDVNIISDPANLAGAAMLAGFALVFFLDLSGRRGRSKTRSAAPVSPPPSHAQPAEQSGVSADTGVADKAPDISSQDEAEAAATEDSQPDSASAAQPAVAEGIAEVGAEEIDHLPEAVLKAEPEAAPEVEVSEPGGTSFAERIRLGLAKTRNNLVGGISGLLSGSPKVDDELLEDIEAQLLMADLGVDATQYVMDRLHEQIKQHKLEDSDSIVSHLKILLQELLQPCSIPLTVESHVTFVILMVGVNGAGKTTTIGKLAKFLQSQGRSVMLAAGDTFRAAAVEQLQEWGSRNDVPVIAQHTGADSASVIFDGLESARAKNIDVLIADTAGRLQNKEHLMEELAKIKRVLAKLDQAAPQEVMLVLDAGTGQNAISQAKLFQEAVGVSGITLTKLDGTAKGGVIFAVARSLQIPIRFIGVGEKIDDLRPFEAEQFVSALFE